MSTDDTTISPAAIADLPRVLADFAAMMASQHTVEQVLQRLGDYVLELLPVDGVGVLLAKGGPGGELTIATVNTDLGRRVEELEVELEEGPCTDALRRGERVLAPDLAALTDRYPRFAPKAVDAGVGAIHAMPMRIGSDTLGSLDIISADAGDLDERYLAGAQLLADVGMSLIANSALLYEQTELANQLQRALDSRVVIEQAKGVLAERHGIPLDQAFDRLRTHARSQRTKVHVVAGAVLAGEVPL
jgi:GAF domain-containing protein